MVRSGFFNSTVVDDNGTNVYDREYYAEDFANYLIKVVSNGVFATPSNNLQVVADGSSGMNVIIKAGEGRINGYWIKNDSDYSLAIDPSDVILDRIDRIVMQLNVENREIAIVYKVGTPSTTPEAPVNERTEQIIEYSLARIYVAKGIKNITQSMITDTRPLESETDGCGLIATMGVMESNNYFIQMQAFVDEFMSTKSNEYGTWEDAQQTAFDTWFSSVQNTVRATSLYREYSYFYSTPEENVQTIEIPSSLNYVHNGLDIINVSVNGMKMVEDVEYTINADGTAIVFVNPLVKSQTDVEIICKKSVADSVAESTVTRLEALEEVVDSIVGYDYEATGSNDNITLSTMVQNFLNGTGDHSTVQDNSSLRIKVNGLLGIGNLIDNQAVFDFTSAIESNRKVYIDFSNATLPAPIAVGEISILVYFSVNPNVVIENANIKIGSYNANSIYGVHGGIIENCNMNINNDSANSIYGVWGAESVSNSKINISNINTSSIYGIYSSEKAMFNNVIVNNGYALLISDNQVAVGNILDGQVSQSANSQLAANVII